MKTAISLPDGLFAEADRLARRLAKSRSQLYREAVEEYISRHDPDEVTRARDRVAERLDPREDGFARAAAVSALRRGEW